MALESEDKQRNKQLLQLKERETDQSSRVERSGQKGLSKRLRYCFYHGYQRTIRCKFINI
jgi:hypothetical protein